MKSAKISDLMFLRALLMLEICLPEDNIKFEMFLSSIEMIIYLLEGLFVVILI